MYKFWFSTHKWTGVVAALVLLNLAGTGFLLLVKKKSTWIQPAEMKGSAPGKLAVGFDTVLEKLRGVPEAGVREWKDVSRLDVRPSSGVVKVTCKNRYEVQLDATTGAVLQTAYRRSDLIESIHDGSFFGDAVHAYLMPATACALALLSLTGWYLWLAPWLRRRKRRA
jgi:uncharacterized iron-regulated membrane protein